MAEEGASATPMAETSEIASSATACALWTCPPLAYGLHRRPGFRCRRHGGESVCGICAGDLVDAVRTREDAVLHPDGAGFFMP